MFINAKLKKYVKILFNEYFINSKSKKIILFYNMFDKKSIMKFQLKITDFDLVVNMNFFMYLNVLR